MVPAEASFHEPEDPETWSHHVQRSGFNSFVAAIELAPGAEEYRVSLSFNATYTDERIGTAMLQLLDGGVDDVVSTIQFLRSDSVGNVVYADAGPLTYETDTTIPIEDPRRPENDSEPSDLGTIGVGWYPQTTEARVFDSETIYIVAWAPSELTQLELFLDLPEGSQLATYTTTGNAHLDTWRDFEKDVAVVSTPATAAVAEREISVDHNLIATLQAGGLISASAGYQAYQMPVPCEFERVFVHWVNVYESLQCEDRPAPRGTYLSVGMSEWINSPYEGTWTFNLGQAHGPTYMSSIALSWADIELKPPG